MNSTEQTTEPSVSDDIDSLYAAAAAVERGEAPLQVAEEDPAGSGVTDDGNTEDEDGSQETVDSEAETVLDEDQSQKPVEAELPETDDESEEDKASTSKRQQKKDAALTKSWDNANKRHTEADARDRSLDQRQQQIQQQESQLTAKVSRLIPDDPHPKYSVDEIGQSLNEVLEEGDLDGAKNLVTALVNKSKAMSNMGTTGMANPEFAAQWEQNRAQLVANNPDLADAKSELYAAASGFLQGDWAQVLQSHPSGVNASVEVAKMALKAESASELADRVKELESENTKLRKATALQPTTRTTTQSASSKKNSSVEDDIADLYRLAETSG